ncbi:MAG: putative Ig domain-containing protein, partial [Lentisphaerota bacterium]
MNSRNVLNLIGVAVAALSLGVGQISAQMVLTPGIDYTKPNFAYSPPLTKFVDSLPGLTSAGSNSLGQYMPLAVANAPYGSPYGTNCNYYEIGLVEYVEQMHRDLPASGTLLRGYVQLVPSTYPGAVALTTANGLTKNIVDPVTGAQLYGADKPHYLGPLILATKDVPVRLKFRNLLPTGAAGDLFLPVDTTIMGAGMGPLGVNVPAGTQIYYTQNRATLHLHGGIPPWMSDGTAHQWTAPAGDNTPYKKGASAKDVSDMPATIEGDLTFYWTNQQSGRLMFFHDHALGITGPNVYAGELAGYLVVDPTEEKALAALGVPGTIVTDTNTGAIVSADLAHLIPLVIQDKTFVPDLATVQATDPNWLTDIPRAPGMGNLWFPHVYVPNQWPDNPDQSGANPLGRWDYGPWFWPPWIVAEPNPPVVSHVPEAFMDTPMVNGQPYPYLDVQPTQYRMRILNACNDRMINLQMYVASPGIVSSIAVTPGSSGYDDLNPPFVTITGGGGRGATATPVIDPDTGEILAIDVNTVGNGYTTVPTVTIDPPWLGVQATATATIYTAPTEVGMVPASPFAGIAFPATWRAQTPGCIPDVLDGRPSGVPDPNTRGPAMIQIGTEGGLLPKPVLHLNQPVGFEQNKKNIVVLNVKEKTLFLAAAERADVIVDFSQFAGKTVILYSDSPAPVPAPDPRNDTYTANLDMTDMGGPVATLPGMGPNSRTIMQFRVFGTGGTAPVNAYNLRLLASLQNPATGLPAIYKATQPPPIIPQPGYPSGWSAATATVASISATSLTFKDVNGVVKTNALLPKALHELFDDIGRMNSVLAVELPFTNGRNQTTVPLAFVDPVTEIYNDGETQIWKITHNGVDTHGIHFHLYNVQVINRVGWDGAITPPDPNELGWKETVRMNPLEDIIVASRAIPPKVPFGSPDSIRPLNPAEPIGSTIGFSNLDPLSGNAFVPAITNAVVNFNWEYVWHCHLLGHEENDMMRPMSLVMTSVIPAAPVLTGLVAVAQMNLSWTDATPATLPSTMGNPTNEIGFRIERALVTAGIVGTYTVIAAVPANTTDYSDTAVVTGQRYSYRVVAFNAAGSTTSVPAQLMIALPLVITTASLADGEVNLAYSQTLAATGGVTPYTWLRTAGALPNGLALSAAGVISGTPTVTGTFSFTVQVRDSVAVTTNKSLSITVFAAPAVTTATLPNGEVSLVYSQTLAATGGVTPYSWLRTGGVLPNGLTLSAAGVISGTPTAAGVFSFTVQVRDTLNGIATRALSITVLAAPSITTTTLPNGEVSLAYNRTLAAAGGLTPYAWTVSAGALPGGLALSSAGAISGTPTTAGIFNFTVQAQDANLATTTRGLSITVIAQPSITTALLSTGQVAVAYSQTLAATGGTVPYIWTVSAGALPGGLALSTTGVISGTPTVAGTFNFTAQVQDTNLMVANRSLSITVLPTPPSAPTSLQLSLRTTSYVIMTWQDNANNEQGFTVERSINGGTT